MIVPLVVFCTCIHPFESLDKFLAINNSRLIDYTILANMTEIFSKCSDLKMFPDVTIMSFLSMHLPAFGFKFVQIKGTSFSKERQ